MMTGGIFFGAGPYFGYIGGKWKDNYSDPDNGKLTFKNDVSEDDWDKKELCTVNQWMQGLTCLRDMNLRTIYRYNLTGSSA